jgi:hypothetical protein
MGEWLPTEKALSANIGGPGSSHPAESRNHRGHEREYERAGRITFFRSLLLLRRYRRRNAHRCRRLQLCSMRCGCYSDMYCIASRSDACASARSTLLDPHP